MSETLPEDKHRSHDLVTTSKLPTPIKVDRLNVYLEGYDSNAKEYLIKGFSEGFRLDYKGEREHITCDNLKSAIAVPEVVINKINKEVEAGRMVGPFDQPPIPDLHLSPLHVVPKKIPGEYRIIHHLSYPDKFQGSINAGIADEDVQVHYATVQDAIDKIQSLGSGVFLAKTDIRNAFRIIPIHPSDYNLLGFTWDNKVYVDRCLQMGCRSSCRIFEAFSTALEWIPIKKLGMSAMVHVIDYFLIIEPSSQQSLRSIKRFVSLCEDIGLPLSDSKTVLNTQVLEFLGITLDTIRMQARLPMDKVTKCIGLLEMLLDRKRCTLKELQSVIGILNFACSVIRPGRAFLRRMINLTMGVAQANYHISLNKEAKSDLHMWLKFLTEYNGVSFFIHQRFITNETISLYTDAAASKGYTAIFGNKWLYGEYPENWKSFNIMLLEFYPIVLAIDIWGHLMHNHAIIFHTDNESLVSVIRKQSSKDSLSMVLVRHLVLSCLNKNILFSSEHIPGRKNNPADALSRLQVSTFRELNPHAQEEPTRIPHHLLPEQFLNNCQN